MSLPLNQVVLGDCVEVMAGWPDNSVDTIITDPPYGISFMGKEWDMALPPVAAFEQMFRVLKPGALAFVMSSPRQDVLWRMLSMLEGVGFELRQSFISYIYKTGFPKALDVSKGIDRKLGLERTEFEIDEDFLRRNPRDHNLEHDVYGGRLKGGLEEAIRTKPASDLARQWEGWKSQTGLKPAAECILMVNKPRSERTIVDNVLRWGTGAMNVDACRIPLKGEDISDYRDGGYLDPSKENWRFKRAQRDNTKGRFPANLLISDGALDTGKTTKSGKFESHHKIAKDENGHSVKNVYGKYKHLPADQQVFYGDEGSPFRFFDLDAWAEHHGFLDVAKPNKAERDKGLGVSFPLQEADTTFTHGITPEKMVDRKNNPHSNRAGSWQRPKARNFHPTVKPVKLMAYLIELGCPPKGIVVDPFVGSGTTCIAAKRLRRRWIGIEINPEYADIARARIDIKGPLDQFMEAGK